MAERPFARGNTTKPTHLTLRACRAALAAISCTAAAAFGIAQDASAQFFHFESPHIHPLELTPDGSRLLAVNTVDQRLEVFDVVGTAPYLVPAGSVVVGVEPVSVRARTSSEAWVVNHMSDSVTVVDLNTMSVKATLLTGDEPCDVVFAGKLQRAFVSVSQLNRVEVFDPNNLLAAPSIVNIAGEDPRGLATDGVRVYAVIAECGNDTTIVPETKVSSTVNPYPGDPNPPPNAGSSFSPPLAAGLPTSPRGGIIVRKDSTGAWKDDNNGNWTSAVTWGLNGNDVAVINANNLTTTYARGFMTSPFAIAMAPDGRVVTVGTEAKNEVRFEPNLKSKFVRVEGAVLPAGGATTVSSRFDLNPHLTYAVPSVPMMQRLLSVGDPRGVVVSANGSKAYVTGMGSSNLIAFSMSNFARLSLANVGEGPTGVALDAAAGRLYTLNRFDGSISVVDEASFSQIGVVDFYDPTPNVVKIGRPFVFDTHIASGLGQVSCNSCHIDSRMDQLAWDLGDPSGQVKIFNESCNLGLPGLGNCGNWHPMKGPMVTQTLVGLAGTEPFHWRGDRNDLGQFSHTVTALLGGDSDFTTVEMARMESYLATISFPPNPNRNLDGTLKTSLAGGNPVTGQTLFNTGNLDFVQCVTCHTIPTGGSSAIISGNLLQEPQAMKVPHLRNMLEKTGFDTLVMNNNRGFGFTHDGGLATLFDFFKLPVFNFAGGGTGDQQRRDIVAFMLSWDTGVHASVGAQATMGGTAPNGPTRRNQLVTIANAGSSELVAKAAVNGVERGYRLVNGVWQTDIAGQNTTLAALDSLASSGTPVTYTLVPIGSSIRAVDRDGDGFRDGDERAQCSDPADPTSVPGSGCRADLANNDGLVNAADLTMLLNQWGTSGSADLDCNGSVNAADLSELLNRWGTCN